MRFNIGDRVVCVSNIPNDKVVSIFGEFAYRWYKERLEVGKIYTISYASEANCAFGEPYIINVNYCVGENNLMLLKEYRKQKLEKLNAV